MSTHNVRRGPAQGFEKYEEIPCNCAAKMDHSIGYEAPTPQAQAGDATALAETAVAFLRYKLHQMIEGGPLAFDAEILREVITVLTPQAPARDAGAVAWLRDVDGSGSLHPAAAGDPGAFPVFTHPAAASDDARALLERVLSDLIAGSCVEPETQASIGKFLDPETFK